jgi:ubiquinone/menaquinone biosynthesis C-methylase UbiE
MSKRLEYQKKFSEGRVVNIGCGEAPVDFGPDTVQVDLDVWNHKNFVQADAHNLPFKDNEFDTAVLGDIVEHSSDPAQMLREAGRVAKKVVATIYEEWRLGEYGTCTKDYVDHMNQGIKEMGFDSHFDYLRSLPVHKDHIVSVTPDNPDHPHHPHIQMFKDEDIRRIVEEAGLELIIYHKFQEGMHEGRQTFNWLVVAVKK